MLSPDQIEAFIADGFIRLEAVIPAALIAHAQATLRTAAHSDRAHRARSVVHLGSVDQAPLHQVADLPVLHAAFDALVGPGRWQPHGLLGDVAIYFPSAPESRDTGWHVDMSFGPDSPHAMDWRINAMSRGRALLLLLLLTDVGEADAPMRLRVGSHVDIARQLAPAGEKGLSLRDLAADGFAASAHRPEVTAVGPAGTVFLCHPFLVHAAQRHRGKRRRILARSPLLPREPFRMDASLHPVGFAISRALTSCA